MSSRFDDLLDAIERREQRSLVWGDVDASLSKSELLILVRGVFTANGADGEIEDCIEELLEARLLNEILIDGLLRYRSRFAEAVRLLARLRQIFDGEDWRGAPRLVSDFRIDIRPRRYPERDLDANSVWQSVAKNRSLTSLQREVWDGLTTRRDGKRINLAKFQQQAVDRIIEPRTGTGTIISAGTGSGKTLAFYLPAFVHLALTISPNEHWTKVLAIYPRNELLKDQLSEAISNAKLIQSVLKKHKRPSIVIGALYGDVPNDASLRSSSDDNSKWEMRGNDAVCPMLRCPLCGGAMLWKSADRTKKLERLFCERNDFETEPETLRLTRESLLRQPPDILFTTTEMLNQRMADGQMRKVFGIDQPSGRRPNFVLLDEAHTYQGASGAQAALVLRRWRRLSRAQVSFVGLSATLRESEQFFADLTGVAPHLITEISPNDGDMKESGAEYQVALRGDPVSAASLLSTSIQSAMLLARVLDPRDSDISRGRFGKRLFVFTDDLDVTHRLYDDLNDAEAYGRNRQPDPNRRPLAAIRRSGDIDAAQRDADGQLWLMPERIGHNLSRPLLISRTTSRDPGVAERSNVVVATAALEVGFNDQTVGAVLQHKAPYSAAAFLQRRGRAGRRSEMRPLTVTVLSDYGRDRRAFQAYEHLFDPRLSADRLPVKNPYVLRMQAGFALIDWLVDSCPPSERGWWLWPALAGPHNPKYPKHPALSHITKQLQGLVRGDSSIVVALKQFLTEALQLSEREVQAILWEPPRALLIELVPTLLRRLIRDWEKAHPDGPDDKDIWRKLHPLPDFLPPNLFSDLNLPEVEVVLPPSRRGVPKEPEALAVSFALGQLAPGRVTRRFADESGVAHWSPIDHGAPQIDLLVSTYAHQLEFVGVFPTQTGAPVSVYRPYQIVLQPVNSSVISLTSNARFLWESGFSVNGDPINVDPPKRGPWGKCILGFAFWLHRFRGSVSVRRFAPYAVAELRLKNGQERTIDVRLTDKDGGSAAVGFEIAVDGCALDVVLPDATMLSSCDLPDQLRAAARTAFFRYLVRIDAEIPRQINSFRRDWLQQIFLSAAVLRAERDSISLANAVSRLREEHDIVAFEEVMDGIFAIQDARKDYADGDEGDDDGNDDHAGGTPTRNRLSRLRRRLLICLQDPIVIDRLALAAITATSNDEPRFGEWLREVLVDTLAEAAMAAAVQTAPRHAALDTFVVDREERGDNYHRIWITETAPGGAGTVEALAERITTEPRLFFKALEGALAAGDLELAAESLARIVILAIDDDVIKQQLQTLRDAVGHDARSVARERLFATLAQHGIAVGHTLAVAIGARLLRPGASLATDRLLRDLLSRQDELETRYKVTLGLREYAYLAVVLNEDVQRQLEQLGLIGAGAEVTRVVQVLAGFLWPRGTEIREHALQSQNRWRQSTLTDPAFARRLLVEVLPPIIMLTDAAWRDRGREALANVGAMRLIAEVGAEETLREALLEIIGSPVDAGPLRLYPTLERVERDAKGWGATFTLREVVGW